MPPKIEHEDPMELMRRKFIALCKFRMLGRLVIENIGWMIEGAPPFKSEDGESIEVTKVPSFLEDLLTKKRLLTLEDKCLLFLKNTWRTIDQKEYLYKLLGRLKCFKIYPKHVRHHLCAVCNFKYFGPGRILAKKGRVADAMYYIVSGEIEGIDKVYDAHTKTFVDGFATLLKPGMEFGQKELLHNLPRPYTYKTITSVELIYITKEDFDDVLNYTIQQHWTDVKIAFSHFNYFSAFTKEAILEGCLGAQLKLYKNNETILGDGKGHSDFVYFILHGTCQFIQTLHVQKTTYLRKKIYKLYTPKETPPDEIKSNLKLTPIHGEQHDEKNKKSFLQDLKVDDEFSVNHQSSRSNRSSMASSRSIDFSATDQTTVMKLCNLPKDVQIHFMQICLMNAGGCFGWEDKLEYRRIVALDEAKCLLLPKKWLWEWNPHNMWYRIKHYYDMQIPNRDAIFKKFVTDRKWDVLKNELVKDINRKKKAINWTRLQDVPYSVIVKENLNLREDYGLKDRNM